MSANAAVTDEQFLQQAQKPLPDTLQQWMSEGVDRQPMVSSIQSLAQSGKPNEAAKQLSNYISDYLYASGGEGQPVVPRQLVRSAGYVNNKLFGDETALGALYRFEGDLWLQAGEFNRAQMAYGKAFDEYNRATPKAANLIPLVQRHQQIVTTACRQVHPQRRQSLTLHAMTHSPIGDEEVAKLGVKNHAEAACVALPHVFSELKRQLANHFGHPKKSSSTLYARLLLESLQMAGMSGFTELLGNNLNIFNPTTSVAMPDTDMDLYFPIPDFPATDDATIRFSVANLQVGVMLHYQQAKRASNLVLSLYDAGATNDDKLMMLEFGATVIQQLEQHTFRSEAKGLTMEMLENWLPQINDQSFDAAKKQRFKAVVAFLQR